MQTVSGKLIPDLPLLFFSKNGGKGGYLPKVKD